MLTFVDQSEPQQQKYEKPTHDNKFRDAAHKNFKDRYERRS